MSAPQLPQDMTREETLYLAEVLAGKRAYELAKALGRDQITLFQAQQNKDLTEGRGPYVARGLFFMKAQAEQARDLLEAVQGTQNDCPIIEVPVFVTYQEWVKHAEGQKWMLKPDDR